MKREGPRLSEVRSQLFTKHLRSSPARLVSSPAPQQWHTRRRSKLSASADIYAGRYMCTHFMATDVRFFNRECADNNNSHLRSALRNKACVAGICNLLLELQGLKVLLAGALLELDEVLRSLPHSCTVRQGIFWYAYPVRTVRVPVPGTRTD